MIFKVCLAEQQEIAFQGILCSGMGRYVHFYRLSILHRVRSESEIVWKQSRRDGSCRKWIVERWQGMDDCDNQEVSDLGWVFYSKGGHLNVIYAGLLDLLLQ